MHRTSVLLCLTLSLLSVAACGEHPPMARAPFGADQARQFQHQWAQHVGKDQVVTNSLGMKLSLIPPGEFTMGRTLEQYDKLMEAGAKADLELDRLPSWEMLMMPAHRVRITKPFYMGTTEVTVAQFRQFCDESGYKTEAERGLNGGKPYKGRRPICTWRKPMVWIQLKQQDDEPVLHLCWNDCVEFCQWLSKKEGVEYCLPTEAEWEYACRAGTTTAWSFGNFEDFDRLGHDDDLSKTVHIRGEPHSVQLAIQRSLGHTCYHVGQIVQAARVHAGDQWETLTIPRGKSEQFNNEHWGGAGRPHS